jgi:non-specific protein-tyrosine kinase
MDLRKSIEKAKKAREKAVARLSRGNGRGAVGEKAGKVPPDYCVSQCVSLDPKRLAENRVVCIAPDAPEIEYYKVLRTQIQHRCRPNGWNTVMITSVHPGEGKTLTSINLALTFAKAFDQTILLVDCDLKRQKIHKRLSCNSERGLINYLMDDTPVQDLIVWPGIEKMTLISGGSTIRDSSELIGSPKMKDLVEEMKHRYDDRYILFDVPPVLSGADAMAFAPLVDVVLMVVQARKTSMPDILKSLEMIPQEKFLGFVLNREKSRKDGYNYYY